MLNYLGGCSRIRKFYQIARDEFPETSEIARTKGDSCLVLRNKSVGSHFCWFWFVFFFSCPISGLCALCEQKRVISDVFGLGEHTDQDIAYSSCSSGSRMCVSLLSPTGLLDPVADIIFFLNRHVLFLVAFICELNEVRLPFLQRHKAKHWSVLIAGEKKLLLVVDLLITAV